MGDGVLSLSAGWLLSEITSASLEVEGTSIAGTTGEISGGKVSGEEGLAESLTCHWSWQRGWSYIT